MALERYADALAPATEAAVIFRQRATGDSSMLNELGSCLRNLAIIHNGLGHRGDALAAAHTLAVSDEAIQLQRQLAGQNPSANQRALGTALNSFARHLLECSRPAEALLAAEEAAEIWRRLDAAAPGTFDSQLTRASTTRDRALSALEQHP